MIERLRALVRPLSEQSQKIRNKKTHIYLPDDMVGYTVACLEIAQRGLKEEGQSVAEQVPELSLKLVKRLIASLQLELDIYFGTKFDRTTLRVGIFARFLPDWYRASTLPSPLLTRQPLGMVIEAAAIAPDLVHSVIVMAYYAELTRVMLAIPVDIRNSHRVKVRPSPRTTPPEDPDLEDALSVFRKFRPLMIMILRNGGPYVDTDNMLNVIDDNMLAKLLYSLTLPFLRRCAIVYYAIAGAYPVTDPELLSATTPQSSEYNRLLTLLGIPRPLETLSNPAATETPIVARWLTQWSVLGRCVPVLEYPGTYELFRLPEKFEDMSIDWVERKCRKCNTRPNYPAICLFCGKMVCLAGDCCTEAESGECTIHMRE
jgi:E3 ubiquitin-protein ligase UBR1